MMPKLSFPLSGKEIGTTIVTGILERLSEQRSVSVAAVGAGLGPMEPIHGEVR